MKIWTINKQKVKLRVWKCGLYRRIGCVSWKLTQVQNSGPRNDRNEERVAEGNLKTDVEYFGHITLL